MDFIGSWAKDAANLGTFTGTCATLTKGPFAGQTGCTSGIPKFYGNTDLTSDAVEQYRLLVHRQVQSASPDRLWRLRMA